MKNFATISLTIAGAGFLLCVAPLPIPAFAQSIESFETYLGAKPSEFATPEEAAHALRQKLAAGDMDAVSVLLGLDPGAVKKAEGMAENFAAIQKRAAKLFNVSADGDQRIIELGDEVWPFPFPIRKVEDGKWAFDSDAGLQEIVNRRIGENELQAIATARTYVDGQNDYDSADRDGDGVLEFAQKLVSTPGKTDGLYWPESQGDGPSPAGGAISEEQLRRAQTTDKGYFGYHFRILRGQGNNIAGGRYNYMINGNMIVGFGLIAWPAKYGITGVNTFEVNQEGIVYEKDLGPDTAKIVPGIVRFNPNTSWDVVKD
jgi:hypothetical protein